MMPSGCDEKKVHDRRIELLLSYYWSNSLEVSALDFIHQAIVGQCGLGSLVAGGGFGVHFVSIGEAAAHSARIHCCGSGFLIRSGDAHIGNVRRALHSHVLCLGLCLHLQGPPSVYPHQRRPPLLCHKYAQRRCRSHPPPHSEDSLTPHVWAHDVDERRRTALTCRRISDVRHLPPYSNSPRGYNAFLPSASLVPTSVFAPPAPFNLLPFATETRASKLSGCEEEILATYTIYAMRSSSELWLSDCGRALGIAAYLDS
ncbi:hypothetical protein TcWFU_006814 [Taenia crassiceps]|uniref:Uncharacterized protein n=1 Tax=Taenia crassiceps TaxID=6207 RepID=A0ABR4QS49_9CEST